MCLAHNEDTHTGLIRREVRLSDSCLCGLVTPPQGPLRGTQPWVTSVHGREGKTSNAKPAEEPPTRPSSAVLLSSMGDLWRPSQQSPRHESVLLPPSFALLFKPSVDLLQTWREKCGQNINKCTPPQWFSLSLPYSPPFVNPLFFFQGTAPLEETIDLHWYWLTNKLN